MTRAGILPTLAVRCNRRGTRYWRQAAAATSIVAKVDPDQHLVDVRGHRDRQSGRRGAGPRGVAQSAEVVVLGAEVEKVILDEGGDVLGELVFRAAADGEADAQRWNGLRGSDDQ